MNHIWNFSPVWEYRVSIVQGLGMTLLLTAVSCILGTALGLILALGLAGREAIIQRVTTVLVEIIRAVPPLVWLIWCYFVIPTLTGISLSPFTTATIVFTGIYAAFSADIFRGAIEAIPSAMLDSGRALGMRRNVLLRRVVIPEVFRRSLPALNGQTVGMLKMSSLASIIAVHELTYASQLILAQRPLPFEIYTTTAIAYCVLIFPIVWVLRWVERQPWCMMNPVSHANRS